MAQFNKLTKVISIEVKWKEGWSGILGAHLDENEFDSYLEKLNMVVGRYMNILMDFTYFYLF